jgi:hypothetical protein
VTEQKMHTTTRLNSLLHRCPPPPSFSLEFERRATGIDDGAPPRTPGIDVAAASVSSLPPRTTTFFLNNRFIM